MIVKKNRSLSEWLQYLETFPSGLTNADLVRVKEVATKIDLLNNFTGTKIVVAGTNGKGSNVVFLESILLAAGYSVGSFLSPHVLEYNERLRVNGKNIDDQSLIDAFAEVEQARGEIPLSYFRFTTLASFLIFKKLRLDVLVLEVGLGGRLDAVNIIDSDVAIISTISLDHCYLLGNDREAIGAEKAAIMRQSRPAICGDFDPPQSIINYAKAIGAKLFYINRDYSYQVENSHWSWHSNQQQLDNLPIPRLPIQNAATALMAIELLQSKIPVSKSAIISGLERAFLIGRFQQITINGTRVILDVAHNPESANLLADNLRKQPSAAKIIAVVGMVKEKDIAGTLQPMLAIVDQWLVGTINSPRAASGEFIAQKLQNFGIDNFNVLPTIGLAFDQAIADASQAALIVVFGSFFTVSAVLSHPSTKIKERQS